MIVALNAFKYPSSVYSFYDVDKVGSGIVYQDFRALLEWQSRDVIIDDCVLNSNQFVRVWQWEISL